MQRKYVIYFADSDFSTLVVHILIYLIDFKKLHLLVNVTESRNL
jgi:hypothetical protein